ncbi:MAG: molybdopterin-dependent oxidoreductase [Deltaproteobacteria bacterium]|uniref:Molybdopterin-dependent oxidoreductase n=1 Tax=Candidatus Zymogenus saltonus TaxID=2844893 RepID=A0A9D8KFC4_9DELT|nr:molybdopterin-dependent oxidoreductase [Candidatus Zymogenus saltonus]
MNIMEIKRGALFASIFVALFLTFASCTEGEEIRNYEGKHLDKFDRAYDNSIRGPQKIDKDKYRLEIKGLVEEPVSLTYDEVLSLPHVKKAITLHCVEGWKEALLFEGVRFHDIFEKVRPKEGVKNVVFYAEDGYSSSLPYDFIVKKDLMLAYSINGRILDERRGFPFQVVAESKLGYKWVKWVTRIELIDTDYEGFWEKRGYSNEADVK